MKYKWDRQYLHLGVTLFIVIICSILFYYVLFENHSLLSGLNTIIGIVMPIIDGCVIAYLLKPIVNFIERKPAAMLMKHYHVQTSRRKKKILPWKRISRRRIRWRKSCGRQRSRFWP